METETTTNGNDEQNDSKKQPSPDDVNDVKNGSNSSESNGNNQENNANDDENLNGENKSTEEPKPSALPPPASTLQPPGSALAQPPGVNPMMMPPMPMNGVMPPIMMPPMGMPPMNPLFGGAPMMPFMPGLTPTHSPTNQTKTGKKLGDWQSYITDKGKTYYFNVVTKVNTWDKPEEFVKEEKENEEKQKQKETYNLGTAATKELAVVTDTVAKRSFGSKNKCKYKDKKDRITAFRSLLSDKQIGADWPWKKVLPKIVCDKRFTALKKLDEKKKELIEWQQDEKRRIQEKERAERSKRKKDYFDLLQEFEEKIVRREYRKAKHYLETDERFQAVLSRDDKEEWFEKWQKNAYKEYKKKKKKLKEKASKQFETRLRESKIVKLDGKWSEIRDNLPFKEDVFMKELSERGMRKIYDDIFDELKAEKKAKLKEERNAFGMFLDELIDQKKIHCRCRFDDDLVVEMLKDDDRYKVMFEGEQKHKMQSIFDDKLDGLKSKMANDKKIFRSFMKNNVLSFDDNESTKDILGKLKVLIKDNKNDKNGDEMQKIDDNNLEFLLADYVTKKREKDKKEKMKKEELKKKNDEYKSNGTKKRNRNEMECKTNAVHSKNGSDNEPKRKRQKTTLTLHDPNDHKRNKAAKELDEGEIEELEEGECTDVEDKNGMDENGQNVNDKSNGKHSHSHHRHGRGHLSASDYSHSSRSRSRSRSLSDEYDRRHHKHRSKGGKRRNGKKDDYYSKKRGKRSSKKRKERSGGNGHHHNIDNILYGIGSDLDENDLYYRGDIKSNVNEMDDVLNVVDDGLVNVSLHNDRGRSRRRNDNWRHQQQQPPPEQQQAHHDLDYGNNFNHDHQEINADSYNLDNDDMARWAH